MVLLVVMAGRAWVMLVQPEINFRKVVKKYPVGTPAGTILKDYGANVELLRSGSELGPEPTEEEKKRYIVYYLDLPRDNAHLVFNYYQELLRIVRASDASKLQ